MQRIIWAARRASLGVGIMRQIFAEAFRERELILRSQGKVYFIPLTRELQLGAFALVAVVLLWGISMTLMSTMKSGMIQVRNDEIREARVAYEDLFDEVLRYQKKVATVTSNLRESQERLLDQVRDVVALDDTQPAKGGRTGGAASSEPEAAQQHSLRPHLEDIDRKVHQMAETNAFLEVSLGKIKAELRLVDDERNQIIKTRTQLRERLAGLEENLVRSRTQAAYLDRRLSEVSDELSRTKAARTAVEKQRDGLIDRVGKLEGSLRSANSRAEHAELDLRRVLDKLEETAAGTAAGTMLLGQTPADTAALRKRTVALLQRLDDLHAAQGSVLDRLNERTVKHIVEAEHLVAMTGLDLEQLLSRANSPSGGLGGPLIEVPEGVFPAGLPGSVSEIDSQLTRWAALKDLLERMPLIAPVDFYHQSSGFGLRRDPFTGKRAMHAGIDLAGWRGAPVYATAPGTVVFAGSKGRYGNYVEIDHGYGIRTRYAHLLKVLVKKDEEVGHRHKIGLLGSTGRSTGPHVHYEVRFDGKPFDPENFIRAGRYVFKGQQVSVKD